MTRLDAVSLAGWIAYGCTECPMLSSACSGQYVGSQTCRDIVLDFLESRQKMESMQDDAICVFS